MIAILDLDGPVLDVQQKYFAVYDSFVRRSGGTPLSGAEYWNARRAGATRGDLLSRSGVDPSKDEEYRIWILEVIETEPYLDLDRPHQPARDALARLRRAGWSTVLATLRRKRQGVIRQLESTGLTAAFDQVVIAEENRGSAEEKASAIIAAVGPRLRSTDFLAGDTALDIEAARRIGVRALAVTCGLQSAETLRAARPDFVFPDIGQAVSYITEENQ